jgi:hypothetical protein
MTCAGDIPGDFYIIRLVGQDEARDRVALHQSPACFGVGSCPVALLLIWAPILGAAKLCSDDAHCQVHILVITGGVSAIFCAHRSGDASRNGGQRVGLRRRANGFGDGDFGQPAGTPLIEPKRRHPIEANRNYPLPVLGAALAQLGRLDEARSAVKAGLALNPPSPSPALAPAGQR